MIVKHIWKSTDADDFRELDSTALVKVTCAGPVVTVCAGLTFGNEFPFVRLDAERYMIKKSGKICYYNKMESRADNLDSVRRSLSRLRNYINTNCTKPKNCRWVTLTYAENMTDPKKLMKDYVKFYQRFCYHYDIKPKYISCAEPQARGAWHLHIIFIYNKKAPFIENEQLAKLWGHGFVNVRPLVDGDNIGAYLTAYLSDIELNANNFEDIYRNYSQSEEFTVVEKGSKKFIKGGRMRMYPPKFNIYRCSRGIKKPAIIVTEYEEVAPYVDKLKPRSKKSIQVMVGAKFDDSPTKFIDCSWIDYYTYNLNDLKDEGLLEDFYRYTDSKNVSSEKIKSEQNESF